MKKLIFIGIASFLLITIMACKKGYLDQVPLDRINDRPGICT